MAEFALHPGWVATLDEETAILIRQGGTFGQQDGPGFFDLSDKAVMG
jgi:hypothetical protein